jgi:hypothetical protein
MTKHTFLNRIHIFKRTGVLLFLSGVTVSLVSCQGPRCNELKMSYDDMSRPLPVMSCGIAKSYDLASFLLHENPEADVNEAFTLAGYYIQEAAIEGVNHDVAFCQMCLETNYLRFDGDVHRQQNNFCGLGATGHGVPGASFESVQIGIRAHIQHLKAYASKKSLQRRLVDPRFGRVRRGSAPYVEDLTGKWAVDPNYSVKIRRILQSLARQSIKNER